MLNCGSAVFSTAEPADRGGPLAIVAIEYVHRVARTQTQYAPEVAGGLVAETQLGSGGKLFGNIESFQRHDRCFGCCGR